MTHITLQQHAAPSLSVSRSTMTHINLQKHAAPTAPRQLCWTPSHRVPGIAEMKRMQSIAFGMHWDLLGAPTNRILIQ
jgi:hypothetical protein